MKEYVCIVGLDEPQSEEICARLAVPCFSRVTVPAFTLQDGQLWVETERQPRFLPVRKMIYHAIYEHDFDFITGLAFWGGACLPNPRAMLDLRLKLSGLLRALDYTRFPFPREFVSANMRFRTNRPSVAKWGNWHCGENKERFAEEWTGSEAAIVEPFIEGTAVRVVMIGDQAWQIKLEGDSWLKSIHHNSADFMPVDPDLLADTQHIQQAFGLEIIANDYMVGQDGNRYLLEVNHIPNVDRFPAIWQAYSDYVVNWANT